MAWRLTPPELPCIPVESTDGVALLTPSQAVKRCFIDDFPELADEIRGASPAFPVDLAIHSVKNSTTPIADELRGMGVTSLRSAAVGPRTAGVSFEQAPPPEFQALLTKLKSETSARHLKKQLQELDVPLSQLEGRWQTRLAAIDRLRVGTMLRAEFKLARKTFLPRVKWAVVPSARELWLDADQDLEAAFFGAIAEMIFLPPRPRYLASVLRTALAADFRDFQRAADLFDRDEVDDDGGAGEADEGEPGESTHAHPGGEPNPALNQPRPAPIYRGGSGKIRMPSKPSSSGRPQVVDEEVQRAELKEKHYAWHCQIDLAKAGPSRLSPVGSYVEFQENRQKLIEAHHPDKASAGGARNAGNLLILSHLNHDRYGRAISRQQVTDALLKPCRARSIVAADGSDWLEGIVAEVMIPATGETVEIFFTADHRAYWLEMAGHPQAQATQAADT
jgi:hypothetical protein